MPPCFQVPLRCVCCILFDAYRSVLSIIRCGMVLPKVKKEVPYSEKFSHGANFRIFRMKASVCENKKNAKFMRMRRHVRT